MKIYQSVLNLVGETPILKLNGYAPVNNIFAKLEFFNPAGSVKDRVAAAMIKEAEESGLLKAGYTIVEPTSGNTGIGLAAIGARKGYKVIIVMPDSMSVERRKIISAYGAEVVLTRGELGMNGAINMAESIVSGRKDAVILGQFSNPANPLAHYRHTGPEIFSALNGKIDFFVAGVGTGGTLSGAGRYLKENIPAIKVAAVEPDSSPVLSRGYAGAHKIQGIGAGFIPETLNRSIIDEVLTVTDSQAFEESRQFAQKEGILVGISSGAALKAAKTIAARPGNQNKNIVVVLPDSGGRYLSSGLYE